MLIVDQKVNENSGLQRKKQLQLEVSRVPVRQRPLKP